MWPWRSWVRAPLLTPFFSAVCRDVGVSPSGKARDFDSRIRKVRILPPQPFDPLAQLVEHLTFNQGAWGSNPQWVTIWGVRVWRNGRRGRLRICCLWRMSSSLFTRTIICGSSSVVECHLAKVDVASPNLVYRSTVAPWPSGKAKLCKSFILQFDSGWRLQIRTQTIVWVFSYEE